MQATAAIHAFARKHHISSSPRRTRERRTRADPLHGVDRAIRSATGTDLRLLYGMVVPIAVVLGLVTWAFLSPSYWLVGVSVAVEFSIIVLVVVKVVAMLDEPDTDAQSPDDTIA
jgi:Flp pilus assembly protein TadB